MATDTDTAEILVIKAADLQWLLYAVRNVQTRDASESVRRQDLVTRIGVVLDENPRLVEFALSFSPAELLLLAWSANEGRCRTSDERLIKGRMQRVFDEASGQHGVNYGE